MEILLILAIAIIIDVTLGDPPNLFHPVAWMGKVVTLLERGGRRLGNTARLIYGILMTLLTMAIFVIPAIYLAFWLERLGPAAVIIFSALLLKSTFTIRGLRGAALKIRDILLKDNPDEARFELRSLVSRNTADMPQPLLVSATVESVAEGIGDSLVAPLFFFLLFGLPGAIAYRVVNTMDAMIGYHGEYEYLGKFAARMDDVLNFIPARISALLLILAAALASQTGRKSWQTALRQHRRTESPNAGWPMAAMAGALDVRLEKVGQYQLGEEKAVLVPATIDAAVKLSLITAAFWVLICLTAGVMRFVFAT